MNKCHNSITMKSPGKAEVLIYEQIGEDFWTGGGVTAKGFAGILKSLGEVSQIDIRINSPGGDVFQGNAIYDALARHPAKKMVYIDGLAASMATLIAMAGDEIHMAANAMFMIHEPSGVAIGTAEEMLATATLLESLSANAVKTYAERTGREAETIKAQMMAETWFTADEAKAAGFVTHVTPRKQLAAHFDTTSAVFAKAPEWVREQLANLKEPQMTTSTEVKPEQIAEPLMIKSAESIDVSKITADATAKATAEASERAAKIIAMCQTAGVPNLAAEYVSDSTMSASDVQAKLFDAVCKKNKPIPDESGSGAEGSQQPDQNEKYRAEFSVSAAYSKSMTVDQYIAMRRVDDGLDSLKAPMNS
jgi:ATP-dependent Clp protease protease subunit